jgi:putative DNA primase/helicase
MALVRDHGTDLRYCEAWKAWLVWNGTHWQRDTTGEVMLHAKQTIRHMAALAEHLHDEGAIRALLDHVRKSLSTASLRAMIDNARSEPGISVPPEVFDRQPWLLNVSNGTLDLQTGTLREHQRDDMLTQCLTIPYESQAQCSTWKAFLWRAMKERQDLIDFLQRAVGYSLSGSTREQVLFIFYGPTKTGKSTFLSTIRAMLGSYAQQADMRTFMYKEREEVRNDLADLAASRLVCAVESQKARRLDEALIKQLTGGVDVLKARFLYQEHFIFKPQFKLFLGTNHKPIIEDIDSAIWERIRLVPFEVHIPPAERNKQLEAQLIEELPGILAWAVRGCHQWQQLNDLQAPDAVTAATQNYRDEMDVVAGFLDECCRFDARFQITAGDLHNAFTAWCEGSGMRTMSRKEFGKQLKDKGYKQHASHNVWWLGMTLKDNKA